MTTFIRYIEGFDTAEDRDDFLENPDIIVIDIWENRGIFWLSYHLNEVE